MAELAELIERARASQPSHFDWTDDAELDAPARARRRRLRDLVRELDRARELELEWYVWIRDVWSRRKHSYRYGNTDV